jgi:anti-anti-sigma factor
VLTILDRPVTDIRHVGALRRTVAERLRADGVGENHIDTMGLVLTELVTNVFAHARPPYAVAVEVEDDCTVLRVRDGDTRVPALRPPAEHEGGYGLRIVETLCEEWGVDVHDAGKEVWASIARAAPERTSATRPHVERTSTGSPATETVRLHGVVDALSASALEVTVKSMSGGGTLRIDLSDVSFVASAGVRLLLQLNDQAREAGASIVLADPPPIAAEVLALTGIDRVIRVEGSDG